MKEYFAILLVLVTLCNFGNLAKLPSNFPRCSRHDPNLGECFSRALEKAFTLMKEPIPSLGLPSVEPVEIEKLSIGEGTGNFLVKQTLTNVKVHHVVDTTVNKTDITLNDDVLKAVIQAYAPKYYFEFDYELDGKVLLLPISGKGKGSIEAENVELTFTLTGGFTERRGKKYIKLTSLKVELDTSKATINFDNLFNGNKELSDQMNKLLNDNWRDIFNDGKEPYEEALSVYFTSICSHIFNKVPYDELFPL